MNKKAKSGLFNNMQLFTKKSCRISTKNEYEYKEKPTMNTLKSICIMEDIQEFSNILKQYYPYYAKYYHNAIAGKRETYGNEYVVIAYGKSMGELIVLCEEKGFTPSERLFDSGYIIRDNPDYNPNLTTDDITTQMNYVLSRIFGKNL